MAGETEDKVFTEAQHVALVESAVARETAALQTSNEELEARAASLTTEKAAAESALSEAQAKLDVLEAEKSAAEQAKVEAEKAFEDFKTGLEELASVEARRADRAAAVKEAAAGLDDSYFTEERIQRWAEMSAEAFDVLVADLKEAAGEKAAAAEAGASAEAVRETAAFKGGTAVKQPEGSSFGTFLGAVGKGPRVAS